MCNYLIIFLVISSIRQSCSLQCEKLDVALTQKLENDGFHREIRWLFEMLSPTLSEWARLDCNIALRLDVSNGMYINPDEIAELNRTGVLPLHIDGQVDIEAPSHEASEHVAYVYLNNTSLDRVSVILPIHLRYQRSQITGGFGKVPLKKPSLLVRCQNNLNAICGKGLKVEAPCSENYHDMCVWKNVTYQAHFDDVELFVPVGDLDDYPLVSIVTLLLGCAGCIYVLSVLSTTPL